MDTVNLNYINKRRTAERTLYENAIRKPVYRDQDNIPEVEIKG